MATRLIGAAVSVLLLASVPARADIVLNGGFETGNFNGWTVNQGDTSSPGFSAPVVIAYNQVNPPGNNSGAFGESVPPAPPTAGNNFGAYFSADDTAESITQLVSLAANTTYVLSYELYAPNNGRANSGDATFYANIAGGNLPSPPFMAKSLTAVPNWTLFSGDFTTTSAGDYLLSLNFGASFDPSADILVDNVSIAAVPEPATWAMMMLGFMGVGVMAYRKKRAHSFRIV